MSILVTGGAGYVGSFIVRDLLRSGLAKNVVVLDNLSSCVVGGFQRYLADWRRTFLSGSVGCETDCFLHIGCCSDEKLLRDLFATYAPVLGVVHAAAHSVVEKSIYDPLKYYENNLSSIFSLVKVMRESQCRRLVFSSSCTVDLEPSSSPSHAYSDTKQWGERLLFRSAAAYGLQIFSLRLFNVCGASREDSPCLLGELHDPETHIIPVFLRTSLAVKKALDRGLSAASESALACVRGSDYDTPDGTCVRDYIHVEDVAKAHVLSLAKLFSFEENRSSSSVRCDSSKMYATQWDSGFYESLEIGSGCGTSIKELITIIEDVTGYRLPVQWADRRAGDVGKLLMSTPSSSHKRTEQLIGWKPEASDIRECVRDTWRFMLQYKTKYPDAFGV